MTTFAQIDRSLVAIFDIEELSVRTPEKMAQKVHSFLELLSNHVQALEDLHPDCFSTGDGVIVSIGRKCHLDGSSTKRFLQFAIDFMVNLCKSDVPVRTALNYSEGDRIVPGSGGALAGQYIQVGDAINIAARVITFCEPRELMVTAAVQQLMRNHELGDVFALHHNELLVTKHGLNLATYTYIPPKELKGMLYSPDSPLHPYKRFTSFPPLKLKTLSQFMANGLDVELRKVVSNAYDSMNYINETRTFLSASEVLRVLTRPNYDPDDTVYVVSRNDRKTGFWTQRRQTQYVSFLAGNAARHGGCINQTRVWVYDEAEPDPPVLEDDILCQLRRFHAPGRLLNFPVSLLYAYEHIAQLIFGFTLSRKYRYAIISIPGADVIDANRLRTEYLGELLQLYKDYDAADGPMKAIITADEGYVDTLITEFENLLRDPSAKVIERK